MIILEVQICSCLGNYFSCKSRFCHSCGKKYTDDWSDKQEEMIFDVPHRHMVFTIPRELRNIFYEDRKKLNELSKQVAEVFQYHNHKRSEKRGLRSGIITVIHTFGRDLKFNPHIHALVTEGALDNQNEWVSSGGYHKTGKRVDKKIPVYRFLFEILQHIPPKHFRMVGRYGLYSRRSHRKAQEVLSLYSFMRTRQIALLLKTKRKKKSYRERMIEAFGKDPIRCAHCGRQMELVGIWDADYGWIYHYMQEVENERCRRYGIRKPKEAG